MSYLAIARKYRPATFDGIVGQEHVTRTLRNAIQRGRIHHAFLFAGARGVGKTTAARALARALNCERGPTPNPCGECSTCLEILAGTSPDLIEIDGASNNSVEDVREIREAVRYAPTRGKWKVYLVDEVHMLSKAAFNALLKTLEEPPPHVVFLFATTEPNKIPDTILSRVQRFDFKRIPVSGLTGRLKEICDAESVEISDNALRLIARAGDGSMRDAQSLLDAVISYADGAITDALVAETLGLIDRGLLYDMLAGLIEGDPARCLEAIEHVYAYGYEMSQFSADLLEVLRNATFIRLSPDTRRFLDVSEDEVRRLDELTRDVDPEVLSRAFTALLEIHDELSRAARPRIVLEMAVARLATKRPLQPLDALVDRLADLERRLRKGGAPAPVKGLRGAAGPRPPHNPPAPSQAAPAPRRPTTPPPQAPQPRRPAPPAPRSAPPPRAAVPAPPPAPSPAPATALEPPRAAAPQPSRAPEPAPAAPASEPSPAERWARFQVLVGDHPVGSGIPDFSDDLLRVAVPRGAAAARASRTLGAPAVRSALEAAYPAATRIEVVEQVEASDGASDELTRTALAHPEVQRIVRTLGAEVERVSPLNPTNPPGEST